MSDHRFTYDCVAVREDDGWVASFPQVPDAFSDGDTRAEAVARATEALELVLAGYVDEGRHAPRYEESAAVVAVSVAVTDEDVEATKCLTLSQAAEEIGVTPPRVTALVRDGRLDARTVGGRKMVTIESVERYRDGDRSAGRPRKAAVA